MHAKQQTLTAATYYNYLCILVLFPRFSGKFLYARQMKSAAIIFACLNLKSIQNYYHFTQNYYHFTSIQSDSPARCHLHTGHGAQGAGKGVVSQASLALGHETKKGAMYIWKVYRPF